MTICSVVLLLHISVKMYFVQLIHLYNQTQVK